MPSIWLRLHSNDCAGSLLELVAWLAQNGGLPILRRDSDFLTRNLSLVPPGMRLLELSFRLWLGELQERREYLPEIA